jgi:hypothetical protein
MRCTFTGATAVAAILAATGFAHAQGGCDDPQTQNATQDLTVGGVACQDAGITTPNSYCRSFLAGLQDYQISCVSFGASNSGGDLSCTINVYHDTDAGPPGAPGADLTLLGSATFTLPNNGGVNEMFNVNLATPICVQPDTAYVIELDIPASTDGFATFAGNGDAETGATYILSADCGITTYTAMADIGFPDNRWVLTVVGGYGCDPSNTCDCNITSDCQVPHDYPGCEDPLCEAIVCAQDPFCCADDGYWDENCAALSATCGASGFPCDFPAASVAEVELCGEDLNGGCNMKIPAYQPIMPGDTVAGTYYVDTANDIRDTDWYSFTLSEKSIVTWTVHSRIAVNAYVFGDLCGDDLQVFGLGSGDCPSTLEACLDAGTYHAFVAAVGGSDLPCGTAEYDTYTAALTATPTSGCPGFDDCPDGNIELTQNSDLTISDGGIACAAGGVTTENWYARSYDLSQGDTAGQDILISCVQYGVQNTGGQVPSKVAVYLDTDGGPPVAPGIDMDLLGERDTIGVAAVFDMQRAAFDPAICVPADSVIVVTLYFDPSSDGFATFSGNLVPADGPTYIMSASCGLTEFTDLAAIGFPDNHWVQMVVANDSCETNECPGDFNGDGQVDGADFGSVLAAWGACPAPCPQDLNGDGQVNGADIGLMLSFWGPCVP